LHRHVDNGPIAQGQAPIVAVVPTVKKKVVSSRRRRHLWPNKVLTSGRKRTGWTYDESVCPP
jgi:hypothetical protein